MDNTTLRSHIINLFILGTAIILVFIAKRNFKDYFVPNVPTTPIGNGGSPNNLPNRIVDEGGHPQGQPMRFQKQVWPASVPFMPKPWETCFKNPENGYEGCGATGMCQGGKCTPKDFSKTAFNIPLTNM